MGNKGISTMPGKIVCSPRVYMGKSLSDRLWVSMGSQHRHGGRSRGVRGPSTAPLTSARPSAHKLGPGPYIYVTLGKRSPSSLRFLRQLDNGGATKWDTRGGCAAHLNCAPLSPLPIREVCARFRTFHEHHTRVFTCVFRTKNFNT